MQTGKKFQPVGSNILYTLLGIGRGCYGNAAIKNSYYRNNLSRGIFTFTSKLYTNFISVHY